MPEAQTTIKKILLVEDEPMLGNLLKQRLVKENYEVVQARDGAEAIRFLKTDNVDLVLLDIILPKMSGFEVMEAINSDPSIHSAPIVIVSNLGQEGDVERGQQLGAVGYFIKAQLSIEELISKIKEFFVSK